MLTVASRSQFLRDEIRRVQVDVAHAQKCRLPDYVAQLEVWIRDMEVDLAATPRILQCHSRGDKRFSALFAQVEVLGKTASIESHYQLSKRFENEEPPKIWRDAKGKKPDWFDVGGRRFPSEQILQFYSLLWCKYLDEHPELVEHAQGFEDYEDIFASPGGVSQADVIRTYCKQGRQFLLYSCREFVEESRRCLDRQSV